MEPIEKIEADIHNQKPKIKFTNHLVGIILIIMGGLELIVGIFSWIFPVPIFSLFYFGEILSILFIVIGIKQLRKEERDIL